MGQAETRKLTTIMFSDNEFSAISRNPDEIRGTPVPQPGFRFVSSRLFRF
jgi:hypothetical protein